MAAQSIETFGITSHEAVMAVREIIRRAFLTFQAIPDPQASFRMKGQAWAGNVVDGYGEDYLRTTYRPTAHEIDQAMEILPWIQYLHEAEGKAAVLRLMAWSHNVSARRLAKREGVSESTIMNRIDRSVSAIITKFFGMTCRVEVVDEPYRETEFALYWRPDGAKPIANEDTRVRIQTVFVYGKGMMRNGKRWDNAHRKAEKVA